MGSSLYQNKKAGEINLLRTIRRSQSSQTARKRNQELAPRGKIKFNQNRVEISAFKDSPAVDFYITIYYNLI